MTTFATATAAAPTRLTHLRRAGRRQGLAMSGQLLAGAGNLVISAVLARMLLPTGYATFVAFLAGYVLVHTVASSVTAAVAHDPRLAERLFRRALTVGLAVGVALAAAAPVLAPAVGLPVPMLLLLGAAAPSAPLLALARGRLYGMQRIGGTVATLCVEPLVRGLLGLALVPVVGPTGAAVAVVAGGYGALLTASLAGRGGDMPCSDGATDGAARLKLTAVTLTFLLVGVVAAQDVILANRMLAGDQAGVVAAVATIGGAAYFATATVPLVLIPSGQQNRASLLAALGAATAVSLAAIAVVALLPAGWYASAIGEGYRGVEAYVVVYVAAMSALGIAKVLLAQLCLGQRSRLAGVLVALAVGTQLALLLTSSSAADVVRATVVSCTGLLVATAVAVAVISAPARPLLDGSATGVLSRDRSLREVATEVSTLPTKAPLPARSWSDRLVPLWPLGLALVVGLALRVIVLRSIWVDEAISIEQAQLAYGPMIDGLRSADVHPPLYATILWALVHLTGSTAEWLVRLPSLLAGIAFIAVMYAMARDLWDRRTARVTAFVTALAPIAVWYSQEARMYAIWMLLAAVAVWMQIRILRDLDEPVTPTRRRRISPTTLNWTLFTVTTVALLYLQWFSALPLVVQHAVFAVQVIRRQRGLLGPWVASVVATLALFAPLVPYLLDQAAAVVNASSATNAPAQTGSAASAASGEVPDIYAVIANTIWALWGYHDDQTMVQLGALWPLALLACFAALGRLRSRYELVLVLVAALPVVALFALGFEKRIFFELRYFTATVPMLLLLVSRLAASWGRGPLTKVLLPLVLLASLGGGLADQQINQSNPRTYDFRGAVEWIRANGDSDDLLLYAPVALNHELTYYTPGMTTLDAATVHPDAEKTNMPPAPPGGRSVFVFGSFLNEEDTAAQVGTILAQLKSSGAEQVAVHKVPNVTVWEFKEMPR